MKQVRWEGVARTSTEVSIRGAIISGEMSSGETSSGATTGGTRGGSEGGRWCATTCRETTHPTETWRETTGMSALILFQRVVLVLITYVQVLMK